MSKQKEATSGSGGDKGTQREADCQVTLLTGTEKQPPPIARRWLLNKDTIQDASATWVTSIFLAGTAGAGVAVYQKLCLGLKPDNRPDIDRLHLVLESQSEQFQKKNDLATSAAKIGMTRHSVNTIMAMFEK